MGLLSPAKQQAFLDFLYELPQGYSSFPEHVLQLIDRYLGEHMLTFIPLNNSFLSLQNIDPSSWLNEYRTLGISKEALEGYTAYHYKLDIFRSCNLPQKYWYEPVLFATEMFPEGTYLESEYGRHLAEINMPHQAVINLVYGNIRLGVISLYRSFQRPDYDEEDRALFREASRFITQHYLLAIAKSQRNMAANLFHSCYKNLNMGVIMVDSRFEVLDSNGAATRYAQEILRSMPKGARPRRGVPKAGTPEVQQVIEQFSDQLFYTNDPLTLHYGGSRFEFYVNSFVSSNSNLSKVEMLYLVFLFCNEQQALSGYRPSESHLLTKREWELVSLIAEGRTNSQIAEEMVISIHTVKTHILNVYKKLEVNNRISLLHRLLELQQMSN